MGKYPRMRAAHTLPDAAYRQDLLLPSASSPRILGYIKLGLGPLLDLADGPTHGDQGATEASFSPILSR